MKLEIWDARREADAARWRAVHERWEAREVFAHPSYVRLFAGERDEPLAAYARTEHGFVLLPFVLRTVGPSAGADGPEYRDVISPYGYAGAFHHRAGEVEAKEFWAAYDRFCTSRRVVSEVTRLSLFEGQRLAHPGLAIRTFPNVVRDLRAPEDQMWREFAHKVRKNVKKAQRSGVTVQVDTEGTRLDDFLRIYRATMDRRSAAAHYYFSRGFFTTLVTELPGQFAFFHALHEGRVVSTELVLTSARHLYSYLGGTEESAFELRPNDLIKYEICRWGKATGRTHFVLGGGYQPDDGIFRYKRAFAPHGVVDYQLGTRVVHPDAYQELCATHLAEGRRRIPSWAPGDDFFPQYRFPLPG
ncbi:GNAT family N-acetyltransferase [Micromonospora haikouensis]|uniref:GNAT family N-acetyltransferase n=1 Tax=Micromonospora haikouensis TaxID=686309 RepID=UPI003D723DF2